MTFRQLWKLLSGAALLATTLVLGVSTPGAGAAASGCAGDVVVALDVRVLSRPGRDTHPFTFAEPLPPGQWMVQTISVDAYEGRSDKTQEGEQWMVELWGHATLGPTTDLADRVEAASATDDLGLFVTEAGVDGLTVRHAVESTPKGQNSVTAVCVGFTLIEGPGDGLLAEVSVDCSTGSVGVVLANDGLLAALYVVSVDGMISRGTLGAGGGHVVDTPIGNEQTRVRVFTDGERAVLDEVIDTSCIAPPPPPPTTTSPPPPAPTTTLPPPPPPPPPTTTLPPAPTTVPLSPPVGPPAAPTRASIAQIVAGATVDCAAGEVDVFVGNQGGTGATVDLSLSLADIRSGIVVAPGSITTTSLSLGDLEDVEAEIRVSDTTTGEIYTRSLVRVDCVAPPQPSATVVLDCPANVVVIRLSNVGGAPAALSVLHERVAVVARVDLSAGDRREVEIPIGALTSIPVRVVDADGSDIVRLDVENVCATDGASPAVAPPEAGPSTAGVSTLDQTAGCASIDSGALGELTLAVGTDGSLDLRGAVNDPVAIPIGPAEMPRAVVGEHQASLPSQIAAPDDERCVDVRVLVEPDCARGSATVSIERHGLGQERFVVLVDGIVAGVLSIDGDGAGSVPVAFGGTQGDLVVSRSYAVDSAAVVTISCPGSGPGTAPLAASLVVVAVLATAVGVLPWPARLRPL